MSNIVRVSPPIPIMTLHNNMDKTKIGSTIATEDDNFITETCRDYYDLNNIGTFLIYNYIFNGSEG